MGCSSGLVLLGYTSQSMLCENKAYVDLFGCTSLSLISNLFLYKE